MAAMWRLGGLSPHDLLKRTARESWQDDVFGQAARLAFYHFLAIFPVLLLLLIPLTRLAGAGADMRDLLLGTFRQFLPDDAASLVAGTVKDLDASARSGGALLWIASLSALWAGINASWAMIVGLNTAYETEEDRSWTQKAKTAVSLAVAVLALVFAALLSTHYLGGPVREAGATVTVLPRIAQWSAIIGILLVSFALFYRFGPNLKDRKWQWSTPGAVFAALLWVGFTLLVRWYFDRFGPYQQIYGRVAGAAVLMMWLYMTSATVLIGAELNSEIEKAAEKAGAAPAARKRG